ncbi:hypothetical protein ACVILH_004367 [Bradyrhizobium sp. USDA 4353]
MTLARTIPHAALAAEVREAAFRTALGMLSLDAEIAC